jgi:hypothetical protein
MSVSYVDLLGSPKMRGNISEAEFVSEGEIPGGSIDELYLELFPPPSNGCVPLPKLCPGSNHLYAYNMAVEPLWAEQRNNNAGDTFNTYDKVRATVTWKNVNYLQYNNSLITRKKRVGGKFLELPNTFLQWKDTGDLIDNPEVKGNLPYSTSDIEIKIYRSPTLPDDAITSCSGCISNSAFMNAPAGCLMFLGADVDELVTPYGSVAYDIVLKFLLRIVNGDTSIDFNTVFDPDTPNNGKKAGWRTIELAQTGALLIPAVSFDNLIP